jgi:YhcG PDDEXK nuclease domain
VSISNDTSLHGGLRHAVGNRRCEESSAPPRRIKTGEELHGPVGLHVTPASTEFKSEHIGQLGSYMTAVDANLRAEDDGPTIGLLLCKRRDKVVAEYALRDTTRPLGIAEYQLAESLPEPLQNEFAESLPEPLQTSLPTIEQLERERGAS